VLLTIISIYAILKEALVVISFYKTPSGREPVKEYLDRLEKVDFRIILKDLDSLSSFGLVNAPVTMRHLKGKLWEIKTGSCRQQRIFYCVVTGPVMILLHACKKQKQGCQREDLALAYQRMMEVLSE
jgi:phage-related protein